MPVCAAVLYKNRARALRDAMQTAPPPWARAFSTWSGLLAACVCCCASVLVVSAQHVLHCSVASCLLGVHVSLLCLGAAGLKVSRQTCTKDAACAARSAAFQASAVTSGWLMVQHTADHAAPRFVCRRAGAVAMSMCITPAAAGQTFAAASASRCQWNFPSAACSTSCCSFVCLFAGWSMCDDAYA